MAVKKLVVFVLEDICAGFPVGNGFEAPDLLGPTASYPPPYATVTAELLVRGHLVVIVSRYAPSVLSTGSYLLDMEYTDLRQLSISTTGLSALCAVYPVDPENIVVVCGKQNHANVSRPLKAVDPATFLRNWRTNPALGTVTSGKATLQSVNVHASLTPLYTELTNPSGWNISKVDSLATKVLRTATSSPAKVQAAYWALMAAPGLPSRRNLQDALLRGLAGVTYDSSDFYKFVPGRHVFHFKPQLVTRQEYLADPSLRNAYLAALAGLFPSYECRLPLFPCPVSFVTPYTTRGANGIGSIMGLVKDWQRTKMSGPNVCLSYLNFAAELTAARLGDTRVDLVVSAPATAYSAKQPGRVSERLGEEIGRVLGVPYVPLLAKGNNGVTCVAGVRARGQRILLIDDQVTTGKTMRQCGQVITSSGDIVTAAAAYSAGSTHAGYGVMVVNPPQQGYPFPLSSIRFP